MNIFLITHFWKKSDFFGRASLVFRYAAYLFNAVYLFLFVQIKGSEIDLWHLASFIFAAFLPYILFVYYVNHDNDKGIGIRQNMIDFLFVGWLIGLIHLLYIPSIIFIIGLVSNYVASRGFHKFYRLAVIAIGYLLTLPIYGFRLMEEIPAILLHLSLAYALIHFISIAYISYRFSKNVQLVNRKVTVQQMEILAQSEELQSLNDSLQSLNDHLEEKVQERTIELEQKNEKLAEYTFINGHQLRAPVATLLGLCNLLDYANNHSDKEDIMQKIKREVMILNITIKEIKLKLETDQIILDKVKEIETEHSHFEKLQEKLQS